MNSQYEDRFNRAIQDPQWAGWFSNISKKELWILWIQSKDESTKTHREQVERLEGKIEKLQENSRRDEKRAWFYGFVIGAALGFPTGWFN